MRQAISNNWVLILLLVAIGVALRLVPHLPNVAPIGAIALFGGLYLPGRLALVIPVGALFMGDLVIGLYSPVMMLAVYGSFLCMVGIGWYVKSRKSVLSIFSGTLLGSLLFFLVTNAAVWAFGSVYAPTLAGLMQSYTMALPFFRNTLVGDLMYVGILVGGAEAVYYFMRSKRVSQLSLVRSL